jgi:hypothetical protein
VVADYNWLRAEGKAQLMGTAPWRSCTGWMRATCYSTVLPVRSRTLCGGSGRDPATYQPFLPCTEPVSA